MSAVRQSAQDYLRLLRLLADAKPSKETAFALLEESADWIECLILENDDVELKLSDALSAALVDCQCCDVSYPRAELAAGLCPTCTGEGCGHVRPRIAAGFPPRAPGADDPAPDLTDGRLVIRADDDAVVPVTGRIIGLGEVPGEVMVAWGDQAGRPDPRLAAESYGDLIPAPVHWLDPGGPERPACGLAADGGAVRSSSGKSRVTCTGCRGLPEFADPPDQVVPFLALAPDVAGGS